MILKYMSLLIDRTFLHTLLFLLILITSCSHEEEVSVSYSKEIYKTVEGQPLFIDIFQSSTGQRDSLRSAIVFYHGGGWAFGEPSEFHEVCKRYARLGFVTFSVQYRLCIKGGETPHPSITPVESVKDSRSAMRWVRNHADSLGVDRQRIVVAGQSVGGQLALATAMIQEVNELTDDHKISTVPNAIISFSGTVNTVQEWSDHLFGNRREEIWSISPFHHIDKTDSLPPVIHFHGTDDHVVPLWTIKFFMRHLSLKKLKYELIECEGRGHYLGEGYDRYSNYVDEEILNRVDTFLAKHHFLR